MNKTTLIGLLAGFALVFGAILTGDGWMTFLDPKSLMIVFGGTGAALAVAFSFPELKTIPGGVKAFFAFQDPAYSRFVGEFTDLARLVRRDGLLALDRKLAEMDNPLMQFGLEMAVDGMEADEVDDLMRSRIGEELQARALTGRFFNTAGTYAPAFGMVGTLIGLIQMLQNLNDPSAIGPAMAVAMITTFYGALVANLVCLPFAAKLKAQTGAVAKECEMVRTGVLAIVRGESPIMVEKRLALYVSGETADASAEAEPTPLKKVA